jgi:hypothetical protein
MIILSIVLLNSCSGQELETRVPDIKVPESVTTISENEFYPFRLGFSLVVFKDKLWIFGGSLKNPEGDNKSNSIFYRDVWNSEDGIHWSKVKDRIFEDNRSGYQIVAFKDKLWAIGGIESLGIVDNLHKYKYYNEIWSSVDGIVWNKVTDHPQFNERSNAAVVAHKNSIWLFGGIPKNKFSEAQEVWKSNNGISWELITEQLPLSRIRTSSLLLFDDWIMYMNSRKGVWRSKEGISWEHLPIDDTVFYTVFLLKGNSARSDFSSTVHNGNLFVLGGWGYPTNTEKFSPLMNDVWRSSDGSSWERVSDREEETDLYMNNFDTFPARSGAAVISFRGMLYLTGGQGEGRKVGPDTWEPTNYRDVWISKDGKTWYELARVEE